MCVLHYSILIHLFYLRIKKKTPFDPCITIMGHGTHAHAHARLRRSEQWLLSIYEEDASPGASEGEPISISLALRDAGGGGGENGGAGVGAGEVDAVRVGLVAVDVRTGRVVHDTFVEGSGQRQELDTRLRHLRFVRMSSRELYWSLALNVQRCGIMVYGKGGAAA